MGFFSVASVLSVVGISVLRENSPKLMTFHNQWGICDKNGNALLDIELLKFKFVLIL